MIDDKVSAPQAIALVGSERSARSIIDGAAGNGMRVVHVSLADVKEQNDLVSRVSVALELTCYATAAVFSFRDHGGQQTA